MAVTHSDQRRARRGVRGFFRRHGWRAYALPVLAAITIAALLGTHSPRHTTAARDTGLGSAAAQTGPTSPPPRQPAQAAAAPKKTHHHRASAQPAVAAAPAELLWGSTESTVCLHNTEPSYVLVSIRRQHVWVCAGQRQIYSTPATTGAKDVADDATPTGSWTVQGKQRDRYLVGPGYRDYVHYWIPFNGDYGFHDATWQRMPFGASGWPTKGSHGCVHLPMTAVKWLYHWAQVGSTVVTVID